MDTVASHGQCCAKVSLGQPFPTPTLQKRHALGRKRVPLRRRVVRHHAVRIYSQAGFGRGTVKIKEEEGESETTESSGTKKLFKFQVPSKLPGTVKLQNKSQSQAKSNKVVFVAGATGKVGSRTVRELLKLGLSVRASTRNVEKAQALFEDVASLSADAAGSDDSALFGFFSPAKLFGFLKPKAGKRLEIVECNLEDPESIEPALGNAGVVVCCIGASEKEVLDVTGPYRIDFKATENLINAASSAEVNHFVLLTSLGTQKFGFPAAVLNLFWGVLLWKAKAEKALIQSGLPYTIVRPGGMERPTDAYKETHNLLLAEADKLFGGQVSNLQVAELLASIVENPDVSVNKIVEAIAETTAPLRPIEDLLEEIPAKDISSPEPQSLKPAKADVDAQKSFKKQGEERIAKNNRALALKEREEKRIQAEKLEEEKRAQAQKGKEEKRIQAERDKKEKQRLQVLRKKYEQEIEAAREKEEAAKSAAAAALEEKAELEKRAAEIQAKAEAAAVTASQAKAVEAAVLAAARKGNVLPDEEKQKIMESVRLARLPKEAAPVEQPKPSSKKKPAFSFLGRAAPTTETTTETEPAKEAEEEKDAESKVKDKADKKAVGDKKQEEEKLKKEQDAKKLAEAKKKEEQERLEKDRVEKEAAEAKQKEEEELAEAKRKEEEEKEKKEAEAKIKEEEEIAKKEAEAKIKEEEERAKKEAEAKRKEEELAEAKRKEEELVEAKKKEEEEKAKEEEEKAKKEAGILKAQEEQKAKALAEEEAAKQAAISAAADEEAKQEKSKEAESPPPRLKGFRWFWQPADPETPDAEESTKEEVADVPVEAKIADQLPPCPTPLSPYARYPGLKPPAPPTASPPAPKPEKAAPPKEDPVSSEIKGVDQATTNVELPSQEESAVLTKAPSKELQDDIEARAQIIQETAAREREALEKAQATISFKWPWQNAEETTTVEESASALKEEEPAASQEPAASVKEQEAVSPAISQDKTNTLPPSSRPLSPYAQFPNLKPPSPPKPSSAPQNSSATNSKPAETLASSLNPLSPYPGFPELKPPTSPTPGGNGAVPAVEAKDEEKLPEPAAESGFKWPWQQ